MRVIKSGNYEFLKKPCGIGLGKFDGLHIGHMMLVETLLHECLIEGLFSVLYTFEDHPENILRKQLMKRWITSNDHKLELLKSTGLDAVYFENFDEEFSRISPTDFVKKILVDTFGIRLVVVGENYRFGYKGAGTVETLQELAPELGFRVRVVPLLQIGEDLASSSNIRTYIEKGNMKKAADILGRYFSMRGAVGTGDRMGRRLGYPTANLYPSDLIQVPKHGVYVTKLHYNGRFYNSITFVGNKPTFGEEHVLSIETHIFDFNEDIYNKEVEVFFIERLRGQVKFNSVEQLVAQIKKDIEKAKNYLLLFNCG